MKSIRHKYQRNTIDKQKISMVGAQNSHHVSVQFY